MAEKKSGMPASEGPAIAMLGKNSAGGSHPVLPPGINETFVVRQTSLLGDAKLLYRPGLLATVRVRFAQAAAGIDTQQDMTVFLPAVDKVSPTMFDDATIEVEEEPEQQEHPDNEGGFATLPSDLNRAKTFTDLQSALKDYLYKIEKLRSKYAPKMTTVQEQLRKAMQKVEKEKLQAKNQSMQAGVTVVTSILGAVFGRKLTSATSMGKIATGARAAGRLGADRQDVAQAEESVEAITARMEKLDQQFQDEATALLDGAAAENLKLDETNISPKKTDITINNFVLCWTPWIVNEKGDAEQAW